MDIILLDGMSVKFREPLIYNIHSTNSRCFASYTRSENEDCVFM